MANHLRMGQFNIVHGEVQEEGPFVGVFPAPDGVETAIDLYVVAEPALPGSEAYCDQLIAALGQLFHDSDLSVTGRLQHALRAVHDSLREWNRKSLPEHWVAAGVSCLAVAGEQAYFAMAGPSAAFIRNGGEVRRLEPLSPQSVEPVGSAEQFLPYFTRTTLEPGGLALLVSSGVGQLADVSILTALLTLPPEDLLPEVYLLARREENFAALVVAPTEAGEPDEADEPTPSSAALPDESAAQAGEPATPRPAPVETRARAAVPPPPEPDVGGDGGTAADDVEAVSVQAPPRPESRIDPEAFAARLPDPRHRPERPVVDVQEPGGGAGEAPAGTAGGSGGGTPRAARKRSAGLPPYPALQRQRLRVPLRPLVVAGIAIGVLVLTWLTLPGLLADSQEDRYETLLRRAQAAYGTAQSEDDLDRRRELLVQADADLDEARQLLPERGEAADLADDVDAALEGLDARTELQDLQPIADLSTSGVPPQGITAVAIGDAVYALNGAEGNVFAVPAAGGATPDIVFAAGREVDGVETAGASHIAWVPGDGGYLLVLDENRRTFAVRDGALTAVTVRGATDWANPRSMRVFDGALYVLDAGAGEILRFEPTGDGFDSPPETVLAGTDLEGAVDFTVASDVFVLMDGGAIRQFAGGEEVAFETSGLDHDPLASPSSMVRSSANGHLYITDGGNRRIVVIGQDGRFRQQLVHSDLNTINTIGLDASGATLVIAAGQSLRSGPVPELPERNG